MCKYCDFNNYEEHYWKDNVIMKTFPNYGYTELRFEHNLKTNKTYISAIGEDEDILEIYYCPICGRKLLKESEA